MWQNNWQHSINTIICTHKWPVWSSVFTFQAVLKVILFLMIYQFFHMKHTSYIFMVIITQHNWLNFMSSFVYHRCRLEACMGVLLGSHPQFSWSRRHCSMLVVHPQPFHGNLKPLWVLGQPHVKKKNGTASWKGRGRVYTTYKILSQ